MRVLIGCERSGVVRRAFRQRGHDAWSCDLVAADDGSEFHYRQDVRTLIRDRDRWDLFIVHPDCTYLTSSGLHWNGRIPGRQAKTDAALDFVRELFDAEVEKMMLENPVGRINTAIRKPDQIIQPNQFGHDASKATCLWLRNLPLLVPTLVIPGKFACTCHPDERWELKEAKGPQYCPYCGKRMKKVWANQTASGQNKLGPSPTRAIDRAKTYEGWGEAMAEQWGKVS